MEKVRAKPSLGGITVTTKGDVQLTMTAREAGPDGARYIELTFPSATGTCLAGKVDASTYKVNETGAPSFGWVPMGGKRALELKFVLVDDNGKLSIVAPGGDPSGG